MDIKLKRSTVFPRIGIEFFFIDDENFQKIFQQQREQERLYVKARCQEEAIYSILNELWRLQEERTIFVVKSEKDWEKLLQIGASQNVYIPRFRADEIVAIPGNTNIFVITEDLPDAIKKTCLLLGQWTDAQGDQLLVETLSSLRYEEFMDTLKPYTQDEDPFIYVVKRHQKKTYYLSNVENTWDYIKLESDDPLWKRFLQCFQEVLNEAEALFSYETEERIMAQMKGETLFWSGNVRNGMLKTLLIKTCYCNKENSQQELDDVVRKILENVDSVEKWKYISSFWGVCWHFPQRAKTAINHVKLCEL